MLNKLVRVTWHDIMVFADWRPQDTVLSWIPEAMTSYGLLIRQDEEFIALASLIDQEGNVNALQLIPTGCVVSIKEIKEV